MALQETAELEHEIVGQREAPLTAFLVSLPLRRFGPLVTTFLAIVLCLPLLSLVFLSPSLFVTDEPSAVLGVWLEARAIFSDSQDSAALVAVLRDGSLFHLALVHLASLMTQTPGQALLMAQGLFALLMVGPVAYGAAMRMPLVPALLASLLVVVTVLSPMASATLASPTLSAAVFLWLGLICFARPFKAVLLCAQVEGVFAGIGIWFLFMTSTPLFLFGLAGLLAALVLQGQRGMVFTMMALAALFVFGACAELFVHMAPGVNLNGPLALTLLRLDQMNAAQALPPFGILHALALLILPLGIMIGRQGHRVYWVSMAFLASVGAGLLVYCGVDPLPLLLLCALMAMSGRAIRPSREEIGMFDKYALAGLLTVLALPLFLTGASISAGAHGLYAQFKSVPLAQTSRLGFSFADAPVQAELILARKLDPMLTRAGLKLSPADQAVLMQEGVRLAEQLAAENTPIRLISAGDFSHFSGVAMPELGRAEMVLTPKITIDRLTDEARVSSQGILYAEYKKASRQEQISPVWDIWIKR